jgi:hypothetical protein
VSKHFTIGMLKCKNVEMRKTPIAVGFITESWSVETLHHKNREMTKCEIVTWSFRDRNMEFQSFGDCDMECQDISSQELSEIVKCRNVKLQHGVSGIATWSFKNSRHLKSRNAERDYCESRRLEGKNV